MARKSTVWFRKQDQFFYTTIRGEKIKLSQDKDEAETAFHTLLAQDEPEPKEVRVFPTFRKLADLFLKEDLRSKKPNTFRMHRYFLQSFCDAINKKRVADLKVHHVSSWLTDKGWGQSTCCSARSAILACLNWAVAEGYITTHPLTKLKRGRYRQRDRVLSPEERELIRANVRQEFRDFLFTLEQTGARPFSELAQLTAAMIDWKQRTIQLKEHKTENKGKKRTIYLTPALLKLLKELAKKYPEGPLFRNRMGNEWTSHDATRRLNYVMDKLKLEPATIYAYRHTYITEALEKGMTANIVAELVGNSPLTIARNYDHLCQKKQTMLEAAKKAVG